MKTYYIFRHGLATKSKNGYGENIITAELLPEGIAPIKKLGEFLKEKPIDYFISSPFLRCKQTYTIVGGYESNPLEGKLSHISPLGKALIGKKVGETITITIPKGDATYKINNITI